MRGASLIPRPPDSLRLEATRLSSREDYEKEPQRSDREVYLLIFIYDREDHSETIPYVHWYALVVRLVRYAIGTIHRLHNLDRKLVLLYATLEIP